MWTDDPDLCGHTSELDYQGRCLECLEGQIDQLDKYADEKYQDSIEGK